MNHSTTCLGLYTCTPLPLHTNIDSSTNASVCGHASLIKDAWCCSSSICVVKCTFFINLASQPEQWYGLSFVWRYKCSRNAVVDDKFLLQRIHGYLIFFKCSLPIWWLTADFDSYFFGQYLHGNIFLDALPVIRLR